MKKLLQNKCLLVLLICSVLSLLLPALLLTQSDWIASCVVCTPFFATSFLSFIYLGLGLSPSSIWAGPHFFCALLVLPWLLLAVSAILGAVRSRRWSIIGFVLLGVDMALCCLGVFSGFWIDVIPLLLNITLAVLLYFATRRKDDTVYSPKQIETLTK